MTGILTDEVESLLKNQAVTILFVGCFALLLALIVLGVLDRKLIQRQAKEVDKIMYAPIQAGLLHNPKDYRECADQKSKYLLFRRTMVTIPLLVLSVAVLFLYVYLGLDLGNGRTVWQNYALTSSFGIQTDTVEVWGAKLISRAYVSDGYKLLFENGKTFQAVFTPLLNLLVLAFWLQVIYQVQGFIVRLFKINKAADEWYEGRFKKDEDTAKNS